MEIRIRNCLWMGVALAWTGAVAAGTVLPLSQERAVEAEAGITSPADTESFTSTEMGTFIESAHAHDSMSACLPGGSGCIFFEASADSNQDSLIAVTPEGALSIQATGSMVTHELNGSWIANAASRLVSEFEVEGNVPYMLEGTGSTGVSVRLDGPTGAVFEHTNLSGGVDQQGMLGAGTYNFSIVYSDRGTSSYDVQFTVAGMDPEPEPGCRVEMSQTRYAPGEVVTVSVLSLENPALDARPVELKMWLGLPDGLRVSARNDGAYGQLFLPGGIVQDFAPVSVLGVEESTAPGIYQFGCRLLDPVSGELLYESIRNFEVVIQAESGE